jgi:hypothetical protein
MHSAVHVSTTVLRDNKIQISTPDLKEGESVDVFVFPALPNLPAGRSALEIIESLQGHRLFESVEDVDTYLKEERGAWER